MISVRYGKVWSPSLLYILVDLKKLLVSVLNQGGYRQRRMRESIVNE